MIARAALLTATLAAGSAVAIELPAPARLSAEGGSAGGSLALATAPWAEAGLPTREITGPVRHEAWRMPDTALTPLQILEPIQAELQADGFETLFTCADRDCGGFDFRYALDLLPEPGMHVDLGNYRYMSALHPDGSAVAVMASRGGGAGYVQISRVGPGASDIRAAAPEDPAPLAPAALPGPDAPPAPGSLARAMARDGHAVLGDLEFATGSSDLAGVSFSSLIELAAWLKADPARQIVLVGHSDAVGALDANIDLSRQRAMAVAARLREAHGVPEGQISAEGVGYLAPVASNATEEGRAANRRVDAVAVTQ